MSSILLSPLQLVLWGPLQPPLVSQSQGVVFVPHSSGAFNNDFSFDFDVINRFEFSSDFSDDFATGSFGHQEAFNLDFNNDFDTIR